MKDKLNSTDSFPRYQTLREAIEFGPVKKLLSIFIFKLAKNALRRSQRGGEQHPAIGILEVYILTVAALEAFINELCIEKIERRKEAKKSISQLKKAIYPDEFGHFMDIKQKYEYIPPIIWNKSFEKGGILWNDFTALIRLRNDIVHYTPEWEKPGYIPDYLRSIYQRLLPRQGKPSGIAMTLEDILNSDQPFMERICVREMGEWAFDTGVNIVQQILLFCSIRDPLREDYIIMFERVGIKFVGIH